MTDPDENEAGESNARLLERARAFGAAFRESFGFDPSGNDITTNTRIRTNASEGDAVRWQSDGGGSREPDDVRYGVVVNPAPEDSPGDWMVAVYQANEDRDGWEPRDESMPMSDDNLERVGGDGVDSLPTVSQVVTNTINAEDEGEGEEAQREDESGEADDDGEADPEDTTPEGDGEESPDDPDGGDENEDEDEREDEGNPPGDHSNSDEETDTDSDDDSETDSEDTSIMTDTDERIKALAQNEDVPFDEAVLEEFDDSQLDAIDPDARADDENGDGEDEDDPTGGEPTDPDDARDEDEAQGEGQTTSEEPESPESPGDDPTAEVEARVNELAERVNAIDELEEEVESLKEENQELREKADPDVIKAKQAREQLAEATETDEEELAALPDETAINMAANLTDSPGMARANAVQQGQQNQPNMTGAPGGHSVRTNTEDESEQYPAAGRKSYEERNGEADD